MPTIYIKKEIYDEIVRRGYEVKEFVEDTVREKIKENESKKGK